MKYFVAGGTGVIGRRAVPLLVAAGHDVTVLTRSEQADRVATDLGARPARGSLFDVDDVRRVTAGHEVIVNLATSIPPLRRAVRRSAWAETERIRTEGVDNLVAAAEANGIDRFVQESVTFTYVEAGDEWISEEHPRTSTGDGRPVAHAEASVSGFGQRGGRGVVLRFGLFYDLESSHTRSQASMVRRRLDPFIGEPEARVALTGVESAGHGVVAALSAGSGVFNVVDDDPPTRREVAEQLAARLGSKPLRRVPTGLVRTLAPDSETQMRSHRVSNAAFTTATGWRPDHAGADGVVETIAGLR